MPSGHTGWRGVFAIPTPQSASLTAACGRPGRGSASPPDWHSLPRLRFAYPSRGAVICCSHDKHQFEVQTSYRVGPMACRYLPAKQSEIVSGHCPLNTNLPIQIPFVYYITQQHGLQIRNGQWENRKQVDINCLSIAIFPTYYKKLSTLSTGFSTGSVWKNALKTLRFQGVSEKSGLFRPKLSKADRFTE